MSRLRKALGMLVAMPLLVSLAPLASAAETLPTPLASYSFGGDDGTGAVANEVVGSAFGAAQVKTSAGNAAGTYQDGALAMTGQQYVRLPDGLLAGQASATVSVVVQNDAFNGQGSNPWTYLWTLGGRRAQNQGSWAVSTHTSLYSSITSKGNGSGEVYFGASEDLSKDKFQTLTATIDGTTKKVTLYINGRQVGAATASTTPAQFTAQTYNVIGESTYPGVGDAFFHGKVKSFAVYGAALTQEQIVSTLDADGVADLLQGQVATLTVPTTASTDFQLPVTTQNAVVSWTSSSPAVISVGATGLATVHPSSQNDTSVTLTATLAPTAGISAPSTPVQKDFVVTVPRVLSDNEAAQKDLDAIAIENADDVRGNFSVPVVGAHGSTIAWSVPAADAAYAEVGAGVNASSATITVSRPAAGSPEISIPLTVTVTHGDVTLTKTVAVAIQPMPTVTGKDEAYVWAFFTGEGVGGEKISLAASKGNNALDWITLNNGTPLFTSTLGEKGLRDPFILESHDGDKFYMLATDLKIDGRAGSFQGAQMNGSTSIEIWESDDLVNWSRQRDVKVSTDHAGNTWAPEAYWDDELGKYVVYWASNLYDDVTPALRTSLTYNRMMYVTTDDFITFSEPQVWIDVDRRGQAGAGSIDATVQKVGNVYYRVYKDENSMTLRQEKSTDLLATVAGQYPGTTGAADQWTLVGEKVGNGQSNGYGGTFSAGEGPSLFKANDGDVNGYQYYLFADQPDYHGGPNHYVPMATTDISVAANWTVIGDKMPAANFPRNSDGGMPRHGTIIPVTRAEYQDVLAAYAPESAVAAVGSMAVETTVGEAPVLPATAHLTMVSGSDKDVAVVWGAVDSAQYAAAGTFTVAGVAQDDSRQPVEATVTVKSVPIPVGPQVFFQDAMTDSVAHVAIQVAAADQVLAGDWDGDGVDTLVLRNGTDYTFLAANASGAAATTIDLGAGIPVIGDFNGDGKDDLALRAVDSNLFSITYNVNGTIPAGVVDASVHYGRASDVPVAGDWDGDGKATLGVQRENTFLLTNTLGGGNADISFLYGRAGDLPLVGDFDGDGKDSIAVSRGINVYAKNSLAKGNADVSVTFGRAGDLLVVGHWLATGSDTVAAYRG